MKGRGSSFTKLTRCLRQSKGGLLVQLFLKKDVLCRRCEKEEFANDRKSEEQCCTRAQRST